MVYCSNCGTKNQDDVKFCIQCGASLYPSKEERERYRRSGQECFGIPNGGAYVGIAIGIIIVLAGLIWFLQQSNLISSSVDVWPFAIIIFGVLIVIGGIFGMRRRT